ncbi:MAG TPA: hypothetical protein VFA39_11565 [Steroidobacteraceae bacterium]|nr:hypothetical protein [Steroidobacteraceae bacterium]
MRPSSAKLLAQAVVTIAGAAALALVDLSSAAEAAEPCTRDQICGPKNPEDFVRLTGSRWAIVSELARPPAGGLFLIDLGRRTARALMPDFSGRPTATYAGCPRAPAAGAMITHGLDIRRRPNGATELFAVNHGGRESIEVFDVHPDTDGPKLSWKGCVILPADMSANAVAALPDGFAVTSFGTAGAQGLTDLLAGRPAGYVGRWSAHKGWARVAGSGFGGDNGVAASADGSTLYVNDWNDGTLRVLSLRTGVAPTRIRLGDFHPDNLHWLPDGRLLIAGQVGTARAIMNCSGDSKCRVGSMIAIVDPRLSAVRLRWAVTPTSTFAAASTALLYGADYWASSFRGDRIVRLGPAPRDALRVTPPGGAASDPHAKESRQP